MSNKNTLLYLSSLNNSLKQNIMNGAERITNIPSCENLAKDLLEVGEASDAKIYIQELYNYLLEIVRKRRDAREEEADLARKQVAVLEDTWQAKPVKADKF